MNLVGMMSFFLIPTVLGATSALFTCSGSAKKSYQRDEHIVNTQNVIRWVKVTSAEIKFPKLI